MKRILTVIASLVLAASFSVANAQTNDFNRYWFLQLQGGAAYTVGETDFSDLISPSAAISVGYQFSPVFGARLNVNGWQAKGSITNSDFIDCNYKFNYLEGGLDLMADLAALFAGYKYNRTINPYLFAGVGANYAFNNDEAIEYADEFDPADYLWDDYRVSFAVRAGVGANIRLSNSVAINLEINNSFLSDRFNSKKGNDDNSDLDFHIRGLVGLTFSFGKAKPAPVPVVVPPAPVVKSEPEPAPVVVKEEEPEVIKEPAFESLQRNVYFFIGRWDIRESEERKFDEVVECLKANPDTKVRVSGYADKETGSAKRNQFISQKRAEGVTAAIKNAGISSDRIITEYFGDTVNPFDTPEENRVAVCLVK